MVESYQTWGNLKAVSDLRGMANVRSFASDAIQSQYAASKRLTRLARVIQKAIDPSEEIQYIAENVVMNHFVSSFSISARPISPIHPLRR